jgi:AcrR family transcriptional regulator
MNSSDTHPTTGDDIAEDPRVGRTRTAIIDAATELMMADGPTEITHGNVAAAANVSRTTVYKHYPTRVDLLRATIEAMGKSVPDVTDGTGDLRTDLEHFFTDLVADLLDDQRAPMIATMMERALHDPTFTAVRDELICDFEPAFRVLVDRGIESGQLRADVDVPLAMASIAGSFVFLRFMSPHGFDRDAAGRVLDEFVRSNAPR